MAKRLSPPEDYFYMHWQDMGFVTNEFITTSGICHYCYDDRQARFTSPILWAIHILLEHPNTNQAIRLRERSKKR